MPKSKYHHLTTLGIKRQKDSMTRTAEVKERIGPIMERMKSSLAQIQALEQSLALSEVSGETGETSEREETSNVVNADVVPSILPSETHTSNTVPCIPGSRNSRQLLKNSMDMLKKKLSTLQRMEESLSASEDRRQNLQHYFLQVSLSKPMLELASAQRRNNELERHLSIVEEECKQLEDKCAKLEALELEVATLTQNTRKMFEMETKLQLILSQNEAYEQDLRDRQAKINTLSIRCDDLECQVEQLTELCNNLQKQLRDEELRANGLEIAVIKANNASKRERVERAQCTLSLGKSSDSIDSSSTAPTDTDADSATVQSSSESESKFQTADGSMFSLTCQCEEYDEDIRNELGSSVDSTGMQDEVLNMLDDMDMSQIGRYEDEDFSSILSDGSAMALIQKLVARIEMKDKENAELRTLYRASQETLLNVMKGDKDHVSHPKVLKRIQREKVDTIRSEDQTRLGAGGSFFGSWRVPSPLKRNVQTEITKNS